MRFIIVLSPSTDAPAHTWTEQVIEAKSQKDAEVDGCYRARAAGLHLQEVKPAQEKKAAKN